MRHRLAISIVSVVGLLCVPSVYAQGISRRALQELTEPEPLECSPLRFDSAEARFPDLDETDAPYRVTYRFSNVGSDPVVISHVELSCGCLSAEFPHQPIPAGGQANISLQFRPRGYSGHIFRQAWVYTSADSHRPASRLTLEGYVRPSSDPWRGYPHRMGPLRVKRRSVTFRIDGSSKRLVEAIACANSGTTPLCLQAKDLPPYLTFSTSSSVISAGSEADILLAVDVSRLPAQPVSVAVHIDGLPPDTPAEERTIGVEISRPHSMTH